MLNGEMEREKEFKVKENQGTPPGPLDEENKGKCIAQI